MNRRNLLILLGGLTIALVGVVGWGKARKARVATGVTVADIDAAIASSWASAAPDWKARLAQDETQRDCTLVRNKPDQRLARAIQDRERARIRYPADGRLVGDWKKGQALAQSGYGGRFTDTNPKQENGGNCYACHQLAPAEISYGTIGPSLTGFGRTRGADAARIVYDHVFDSQASVACSGMPRFGASGFLTQAQIVDLVAYVVSPDSPVNR